MNSFWRALEDVRGLVAVRWGWRGRMGEEFEAVKGVYLRARAGAGAGSVPCPHECGCAHEVIHHDDGKIVAVCRCESWNCDDLRLGPEDVVLWSLNWSRLGRALAMAFGVEPREATLGVPGVMQIGAFGGANLPVVLSIQHEPGEFRNALVELAVRLREGFVVLSPSSRFFDMRAKELLAGARAGFFDLESQVALLPDGRLQVSRGAGELFVRFLPEQPEEEKGVRGPAGCECVIIQEGRRRRAGRHDRTVASTWRIRFLGHEVLMPGTVGTEYVVHLIRNQGREFTAATLTAAVRKHGPGGGDNGAVQEILHGGTSVDEGEDKSAGGERGRIGEANERDVVWDEGEIAGCLRRLRALRAELSEHEEAGDTGSEACRAIRAAVEQQEDLLRANANQVKGKWVPREYRKGSFSQKADLIRKHVRKLLDEHLRENCRPLFDHLHDRETLSYGVRNRYCPKPRIEWEVQLNKS